MKLKKKLFMMGLSAIMVLSIVSIAYAATATVKKGDYKMQYKLYSAKVGHSSGAGAATIENSGKGAEVYAYVGMYSYKGNTVKNSGTKTQISHVTLTIPGKGGKKFKSYHTLKNEDYKPIGNLLSLTM